LRSSAEIVGFETDEEFEAAEFAPRVVPGRANLGRTTARPRRNAKRPPPHREGESLTKSREPNCRPHKSLWFVRATPISGEPRITVAIGRRAPYTFKQDAELRKLQDEAGAEMLK